MMFLPEKWINAKVRTVSRLTSLHAGLSEPKQEKKAPVLTESGQKEVDKVPDKAYIVWKEHRDEFTEDERDILLALGEGTLVADQIIQITQIPARRVLSALTMLQIRGLVEEKQGRRFSAAVLLKMD